MRGRLFASGCWRFGVGLIWALVLAGCGAETAVSPIAVPTLAAAAGVPTAVANPEANLPATFTPPPDTAVDPNANFNQMATLRPTATPSIVPTYPTGTPRPTRTPTPSVTPDVTATPTRYVSVIPNLPPSNELGPSKLGIHVVRNNDPAIMEFVRRSQPAVMKGVDDLGFLEEVKAVSPRTITIGRLSARDQSY
ncbi:MAG: hypothetical protein KA362_15480, partial [Chloroflexi bacterium]|nr:hypothetical protein [Chloroflexota bacterium]